MKIYPIIFFFILTYAISWGIWIPMMIAYQTISEFEITAIVLILAYIGLFGPTISAFIVTFIYNGKKCLKKLLNRLFRWRVKIIWYLIALFAIPSVRFLALGLYAVFGGDVSNLNINLWYYIFISFPILLIGAIAEEIGWRGYAQPQMQKRFSAFLSSLIIGFIWAFWHLPGFIWSTPIMTYEFPFYLFLINVISTAVLSAWILNNSNSSILLLVLFHTALNCSYGLLGTLLPITIGLYISNSILLVIFASLIVIVLGKNLIRSSKQITNI